MKERIARQVGMERARYLWMGTFHSVFYRILRAEAKYIGCLLYTSQNRRADHVNALWNIIDWDVVEKRM